MFSVDFKFAAATPESNADSGSLQLIPGPLISLVNNKFNNCPTFRLQPPSDPWLLLLHFFARENNYCP